MLVEAAVPHIETLLNRKLRDSVTARDFCKTLDGKVLALEIQAFPQRILLAPIAETLEVLIDDEMKADVTFSGSVLHFMQATQTKPMELVRKGQLKLKGDAVTAGQFQRLIELAMPDWQEEIAKMFGDYAGPQIGSFFKGILAFGQQAIQSISSNAGEFIQEESQAAPSREEYNEFCADVQEMQESLKQLSKAIKDL